MSTRSLLASAWALDVNTGTSDDPEWTPIKGMSSFKETIDSTMEDDSDFDDPEWGSDEVTQRKWRLECEGKRKRDADNETTFTPDPGQEFIRRAGNRVGVGSGIEIRYYRRDGAPDAWQGRANVQYGGGGGATTALEPFNFTLGGRGSRTELTPYPDLETETE
ncbi:phage tail tube protein [Streptosporangium sp. NPDC087985]|uniref:phage tail tube protein n=1 Tax=Streptosporangium sp. NPDC087985 TaxID=3366196 RepID=UPI0038111823